MGARVLRWQGRSASAACREALAARLAEWSGAWGVEVAAPELAGEAKMPEGDLAWRLAECGQAKAWLGLDAARAADIGTAVAGMDSADGMGLAGHLARRALDALAGMVVGAPTAACAADAMPMPEEFDPRHGSLLFRTAVCGVELFLLLGLDACDALRGHAYVASGGLVPCRVALGPEPVKVEVCLPIGRHALSEWKQLRSGDVLALGSLKAAHVLMTSNQKVLGTGRLAANGQRRAVQVTGRPDERGSR